MSDEEYGSPVASSEDEYIVLFSGRSFATEDE